MASRLAIKNYLNSALVLHRREIPLHCCKFSEKMKNMVDQVRDSLRGQEVCVELVPYTSAHKC